MYIDSNYWSLGLSIISMRKNIWVSPLIISVSSQFIIVKLLSSNTAFRSKLILFKTIKCPLKTQSQQSMRTC